MPEDPTSLESHQDHPFHTAEPAGKTLLAAILSDRSHLRADLADDIIAAGIAVADDRSFSEFCEETAANGLTAPVAGHIILADCPAVGGSEAAALRRLANAVQQGGQRLILSTTLDALDEVRAVLGSCEADLLVAPGRSEWLLALARAAAETGKQARQGVEESRLLLLQLTEQISRLSRRVETFSGMAPEAQGADAAGDHASRATMGETDDPEPPVHAALPDPQLVRRIIRQRQMRGRFFDATLLTDPVWDMVLDLTAARAERKSVTVTSLCIASGAPPSTAVRWIGQLIDAGMLERRTNPHDRRSAYIDLTSKAVEAVSRYFEAVGRQAVALA